MIILQRILISAVTVPTYTTNPGRFYLYSFMQATIVVGTNLIPLYMGYHYFKIARLKVLHYFSRFFFLFAFSAIFCNVFLYSQNGFLNIRDYWLILTPISQNYFTYAVSCTILFGSIPYLTKLLKMLDQSKLQLLLLFLTIGLVGCSTLFNKDPFALQEGKNILWIFYLFLVGYTAKEFNWAERLHYKFLQAFIGLILLCLFIPFMAQISLIIRGDVSTASRFSAPFSLFAMYYTFFLFLSLESLADRLRLNVRGNLLASALIATQILCNWPAVNYYVSTIMKKSFPDSGKAWVMNIGFFFIYYFVATFVVTFVLWILQQIPLVKRWIATFTFHSVEELLQQLKKIKIWLVKYQKYIYVSVFFYLFTYIQMVLIDPKDSFKQALQLILKTFTNRQPQMLLTVMIIMGFFYLLLLISNRFWYAFTATIVIDLLLTVSTIIKMQLREEPVYPSDLKMLNSISELLGMVNPIILMIGGIVLLFLLVTSIFIQRKLAKQYALKIRWKNRLLRIAVVLFCFSGVFFINHKNSPSFLLFNLFKVDKTFFNQQGTIKMNGPLIQFLINIDIEIMEKPKNYSEEKIKEIMDKYTDEAETINEKRNDWLKNQTIILNLSESFSNPTRIPNLSVAKDPIPYINQLVENKTSGLMLSVGYGGGTANMEWEGLTGLDISNLAASLVTPYTQLVNKQAISPNITNLFDEKIAIHPFTAALYQRKKVFEKFGFDRFYHIDSKNKLTYTDKIEKNPFISDEASYNETLKALKSNMTTSQFIQLSTMQNHMPYDDYYRTLDYTAEGSAVVGKNKQALQTYMQGIHYTDEAVKAFIQELDKIEKPITFVFFGDHLPSLYNGNDSKKYGLIQHETDYFIYSNKFSREQAKKLTQPIVSASNFGAMALEQANIKVTPYYALLTAIVNQLPASTIDPTSSLSNRINGKQVFVTEENKIIHQNNLTKKQKELLEDYQLIQYDLVAGKQYSATWASQKVNNTH